MKSFILASILIVFLPVKSQAQNIEKHKDYRVSCGQDIECNNFDIIYKQESKNSQSIAQTTRTRRTRNNSSNKKLYLGVNGGIYFTGGETEMGYGPSVVAGLNIAENLSLELEGFYYVGGIDEESLFTESQLEQLSSIDLDYGSSGAAVNVSTKYPFDKDNPRSVYGIGTVGIGYSHIQITGEASAPSDSTIDVEELTDSSASGLLLNSKLGLGIPLSDSLDITGQFRYSYAFYPNVEGVSLEDDSISIDLGLKLNI